MQLTDTRHGLNQAVIAKFRRYRNGQTAIQLVTDDGEPWLTATYAMTAPVPPDCVALKNWSENAGVPEILVAGGVLEAGPVAQIASGHVLVPIFRLTARAAASIPAPVKRFGLQHVCDELGFPSREALLMAAASDDCPSVCRTCGSVNESGHEPDARGYDCQACGEPGTVNSVLVIAGLI
jgi:hypothetical protein